MIQSEALTHKQHLIHCLYQKGSKMHEKLHFKGGFPILVYRYESVWSVTSTSTKTAFWAEELKKTLNDLHERQRDKWMESSRRDFTSPRGFPKEMGSLGSDGSLTPCLLTERTLKRYCSPLTRSNTGNRGDDTTTSKLASSQRQLPSRDWGKNTGNEILKKKIWFFVFSPVWYSIAGSKSLIPLFWRKRSSEEGACGWL